MLFPSVWLADPVYPHVCSECADALVEHLRFWHDRAKGRKRRGPARKIITCAAAVGMTPKDHNLAFCRM